MPDQKGLVLITGASGGIGYELAKLFANDGYPLLLTARSGDKLRSFSEELAAQHGVAVSTCVLDLAKPDAPNQLFDAAQRQGLPVACLVNNAGFGAFGPFAEADLDTVLQILQLNIVALTQLTRLFLTGMTQRDEGRILNVASMAAFQPGPLMAVYYASKAYVLHFSEALSEELRNTNVRVTALCPGPTATGFEERAGLRFSKLFTRNVMDVRTVAEVGYRGLMRGRRMVIPGVLNRVLMRGYRVLPRTLLAKVVRHLQEVKQAK
jgi:short-subunit dehydrogenase